MLKFALLLVSIFLLTISHWITHLFGQSVTMEQMVFHVLVGRDAVESTDFSVIKSFIKWNIILPISMAVIFTLVIHIAHLSKKENLLHCLKHKAFLWLKFIKKSCIFTRDIILKITGTKATYFLFLLFSLGCFSYTTHLLDYVKTFYSKDSFTTLYVNPKKIDFIKPSNKKNLILIYVESLEYNLRNSQIHNSNLIKAIDNLDGINVLLTPAPGTGWSIAGMTSSQCSIPLKSFYGNSLNTKNTFLPNLICLGDILKHYGYTQYFLTGNEVKFAGKDKFYKNHGYDYIYGSNEWKQKGVNASLFNGWGNGIHDDTLFSEAKKIIAKSAALKRPYNLTLITIDSHAPNGWASPRCSAKDKDSGFRGAFHCSSQFVANFINDLDAKGMLANTMVIIMGDHPFMDTPKQSYLFPKPRYVYFKIIDRDNKKTPTRDRMVHFDVAPTILDLLGILNGENAQFGLGFSLFSKLSKSDYSNHFSKVTDNNILNHSIIYDAFWLPKSDQN